WTLLLYDFKEDLNAYLAGTPESVQVRTLADLIEFNKTHPQESMHGQEVSELSQATTGGRKNPMYVETLAKLQRMTREEGIDRLLKEYDVDALVSISGGPAQVIEPDGSETGNPLSEHPRASTSVTTYAAIAGYPHLSVP